MKFIYRLLKLCPCYDFPDKFMIGFKDYMFQNIRMGKWFKCEECAREIYRAQERGKRPQRKR